MKAHGIIPRPGTHHSSEIAAPLKQKPSHRPKRKTHTGPAKFATYAGPHIVCFIMNDPEYDMQNLDHVVKEMKKLKCFRNMAYGEFLVILGNCNTNEKTERYLGYRVYLYNSQTQCFSH